MKIYLVIVLSELISLLCMINLWRKSAGPANKVLWSFVLLIPLVGPVLYGASDAPEKLRNPGGLDQQLDSPGLIMRDVGWKESEDDDD